METSHGPQVSQSPEIRPYKIVNRFPRRAYASSARGCGV